MSKFIYFTPEEKARAQNTDLVALLRAQGERPIRSGREYRTPNDPSVTVRGNKWYDHSARVGGYAVSFVQRYYRLSYQEAVLLLLGRKDGKRYEQAQPAPAEPKPFALPDPYDNMRRVYAYLMRQRHIDREVITGADKQKLLLETLRVLKKGGVFAIHDLMSPARYGDMEEFARQLKAQGYEKVELIDTTDGRFMTPKEAKRLMLKGSTLLVGRK